MYCCIASPNSVTLKLFDKLKRLSIPSGYGKQTSPLKPIKPKGPIMM